MLDTSRYLRPHSNQQINDTANLGKSPKKFVIPVISIDGSSRATDTETLPHSALSQQPSELNPSPSTDQHSSQQTQLVVPNPSKADLSTASKSESNTNLATAKKKLDISFFLHHPFSAHEAEPKSTASQNPSKLAPPTALNGGVSLGASAGPPREGLTGNADRSRTTQRDKPAKTHHETKSGAREREDAELLLGSVVAKEWAVDRKIASGSFGTLFVGRHITTKECVAIKAERKDSTFPQLHREKKFYQILTGGEGIPQILFFGECSTGNRYQILVMDLLGPNVEDLLQACGGSFSLKTTCMLACQLLTRMEYIHSKGILYRDIKSENFLIGRRKERNHNLLHVVDFGLSKEYINPVSKQHIPFSVKKGSVGTPRYMSINALQHHEQGRRDDLEALSYLFLYLYLGHLPWQGLPGSTFAEKCKRILEKKLKISVDEVCNKAPIEFGQFMKYARNLEFEAKPDYLFCRQFFLDMLKRSNADFDNVYDWTGKIPEFWKIFEGLTPLPDDLPARVRAAEEHDVPFNIRASRAKSAFPKAPPIVPAGKTEKKSGAGCLACCAVIKRKFSGASRRNSTADSLD